MFDILAAGGLLMIPLVLASILALAICFERFMMLRVSKVAPASLLNQTLNALKTGKSRQELVKFLRGQGSLGNVFAVGMLKSNGTKAQMVEAMEAESRRQIHEMEKYLNLLGSIAAIAPLLGLLGTVIGMIDVFTVIMVKGSGDSTVLAGGISKALVTTAVGLVVAIPAMFAHRFFIRRIEDLTLMIEINGSRLLEVLAKETPPARAIATPEKAVPAAKAEVAHA